MQKEKNASYQARVREFMQETYLLDITKIEERLPIFLGALKDKSTCLEQALINKDLSTLYKASHALKGALLNLGLSEVAEQAKFIEQESKAGNTNLNYRQLVTDLQDTIDRIVSA